RRRGRRIGITTSHPAIIRHCQRCPHWRLVAVRKHGSRGGGRNLPQYRGSRGRAVISFEYLGRPDHSGKTSPISRKTPRPRVDPSVAAPPACRLN
ncbi:MAG: hypothetical protein H5T71_09785, partial [Chloroflexi bacterium]|nr:hypothetical protein [Chloroflexota bacterium]